MPNWLGAIDIGPVRDDAYSSPMRALPTGELHERVERLGAMHLEHGANLQVILQILADRRVVVDDGDPVLGKDRRRPDARELENARRVDRAGGEQDLRVSESVVHFAALAVTDAAGALALEQDRLGRRVRQDAQVGTLHRRSQGSPWRYSSANRCAG